MSLLELILCHCSNVHVKYFHCSYIIDEDFKKNISIQMMSQRETHVYKSLGHVLQISIALNDPSMLFILRYQSKYEFHLTHILSTNESIQLCLKYKRLLHVRHACSVEGCPDLATPEHAWIKRSGDLATVGCKHSNKTWKLTCHASQWIGGVGRCPTEGCHSINDQRIIRF